MKIFIDKKRFSENPIRYFSKCHYFNQIPGVILEKSDKRDKEFLAHICSLLCICDQNVRDYFEEYIKYRYMNDFYRIYIRISKSPEFKIYTHPIEDRETVEDILIMLTLHAQARGGKFDISSENVQEFWQRVIDEDKETLV